MRGIELDPRGHRRGDLAGPLGGADRPRRGPRRLPRRHASTYVILSQTLQVVRNPVARAARDAAGGRPTAIVSFPNFGYWRVRGYLALKGRMPVSESIPFSWYDTPNIHHTTLKDFRDFVAANGGVDRAGDSARGRRVARARATGQLRTEPVRRHGGRGGARARVGVALSCGHAAPSLTAPSPPSPSSAGPSASRRCSASSPRRASIQAACRASTAEFPLVATAAGAVRAEPAMHLVKTRGAGSRAVVGDWVALSHPEGHDLAIIEAILPRATAFARKDPAEETVEQVLIANVDVVFVVQSLSGRGLNVRRLERELVLAWESGATPVVILTKADIAEDVEYQKRPRAEDAAPNVEVIVESARQRARARRDSRSHRAGRDRGASRRVGRGQVDAREPASRRGVARDGRRAQERRQGPSHDRRARDDADAGRRRPHRHARACAASRSGMRATASRARSRTSTRLSERCRFRDCTHTSEPGCAVIAAVESGALPLRRLESYLTLQAELTSLAHRQDQKAWAAKGADGEGHRQVGEALLQGPPGQEEPLGRVAVRARSRPRAGRTTVNNRARRG